MAQIPNRNIGSAYEGETKGLVTKATACSDELEIKRRKQLINVLHAAELVRLGQVRRESPFAGRVQVIIREEWGKDVSKFIFH